MPKMKTHSGAAKRFRVTGGGKIMRSKANRNHILEKKASTRTRRLKGLGEVDSANLKGVKRQLGLR